MLGVKPRAARPMSRGCDWYSAVGIAVVLLGVWVARRVHDVGLRAVQELPLARVRAREGREGRGPARARPTACRVTNPVALFGRYVTGVPLRLLHLAMTSTGAGNETEYGQVTTRACSSCHAASLPGTTTNVERGLKVSHAEPLAASATLYRLPHDAQRDRERSQRGHEAVLALPR